MSQFEVIIKKAFSSAHALRHYHGATEPLHGHNYEVEVMAESDELDERGFVVDFGELDDVKRWIDATLDHRHLNEVMEGQPSAEAIARLVHDWCRRELPSPVADRIAGVRVWETPKAYAEYRP